MNFFIHHGYIRKRITTFIYLLCQQTGRRPGSLERPSVSIRGPPGQEGRQSDPVLALIFRVFWTPRGPFRRILCPRNVLILSVLFKYASGQNAPASANTTKMTPSVCTPKSQRKFRGFASFSITSTLSSIHASKDPKNPG